MSQPNKFAAALKNGKNDNASAGGTTAVAEPPPSTQSPHDRPARRGTKHVGGYFDPAVSKQLRSIALEEDSSVQVLLAEAIDMLFQSRQKATIAQKPAGGSSVRV